MATACVKQGGLGHLSSNGQKLGEAVADVGSGGMKAVGSSKLSRGLHCDTLPGEKAWGQGEGTLLERGGSLQHLTHPRHFTTWLFLYEAAAPPAVCFEVRVGTTAHLKPQGKSVSPKRGQQMMCTDEPDFGVLGPLIFVKG